MLRRIWENARTIFCWAGTFWRIIGSKPKGWLQRGFHLQRAFSSPPRRPSKNRNHRGRISFRFRPFLAPNARRRNQGLGSQLSCSALTVDLYPDYRNEASHYI